MTTTPIPAPLSAERLVFLTAKDDWHVRTDGGSFNKRSMPRAEQDVDSGVGIAVMNRATVATTPGSYSKRAHTFRAAVGDSPAARARLGGKPFVHFFVPPTAPNGFIAEHVSESGPACVLNRFRHAGFGEPGRVHVSCRDVVEFCDDLTGRFVQMVTARIPNASVYVFGLPFLARPLRRSELQGVLGYVPRVFNHDAIGQRRKVFQAKVYANCGDGCAPLNAGNFQTDIQEPVSARVLGKTAAVLDDGTVRNRASAAYPVRLFIKSKAAVNYMQPHRLQRNPSRRFSTSITKPPPPMLSPRLGVLLANASDDYGQNTDLSRTASGEFRQIKMRRPFLIPLHGVALNVVAIIPYEIDRPRLPVELAMEIFNAVFIVKKHAENIAFQRIGGKVL